MQVKELWRYPVKSLQGQPLNAAMLTADGVTVTAATRSLNSGERLVRGLVVGVLFAG
jgi:hypothetical protein